MPGTALGITKYNGYTFDGATESSCSIEFVKDEAQRTTIYHKMTFAIRGYATDPSGVDSSLTNLRNKLSKQGQEFVFTGHGLGNDIIVNATSGAGLRDVKWGPIPQILEWEPVGANKAIAFTWQVVVHLPVCGGGFSDATRGLLSLNYGATFRINDRGYTTRTIKGHLIIAQTRNGRTVPDCADLYRNLLAIGKPDDFTREQDYDVSLDKSRLDFSITDTQIESRNPYPQGVVRISAGHRVAWSSRSRAKLANRISMEIEMAAGYSAAAAWAIFGTIVGQRIAIAQQFSGSTGVSGIFIESLEVEEDIFGTRLGFSMGWRILGSLPQAMLTNLSLATGVWTPVQNANWQYWSYSLQQANSNRGNAGLVLLPQNDTIIDLCGAGSTINWNASDSQPQNPQFPTAQPLVPRCPPKGKSWLRYSNYFASSRERPVSVQKYSQTPDSEQGDFDPQDDSGFSYPPAQESASAKPAVIQQGGRSQYYVTMIGHGKRVCYEIPRPRMVRIGGQLATEVDGNFAQKQGETYMGLKTYEAIWSITYALPNSPGRLPPPINAEFQ